MQVPRSVKLPVKRVLRSARLLTSKIRLLPDFVIIGGQRCGTTSLYNYLVAHPCVASAFAKEVHFFDLNFRKGTDWYRSHFSSLVYEYLLERLRRKRLVTGEASPYYIFHPHAAKRVSQVLPRAKIIALLRNPVDRAYSHYHLEVRHGHESLPFDEAVEQEQERLRGEMERMLKDEDYHSFNHQHYSYLSRGVYVHQLAAWTRLFPEHQILVLRSEALAAEPSSVYAQVLRFLGLPLWQPQTFKPYHLARYPEMNAAVRERLTDHFAPHNHRLYELLGVNLGWEE